MRRARDAAFVAVFAALLLFAAPARAGDLPEGMAAQAEEGKKWFREAGNTDLSTADRNAARVNAWKALWPVKEALDRQGEEHPADADALDRKYGEVRMMVHWIKKESPMGLLESTGVGPAKNAPRPPAPAPPSPAPAPGTPPAPTPAPIPAPAPSPEAPPPQAATPEALLAEARDYEKRHPHDVPGLQEMYLRVSGAEADLSNPAVRDALDRVGELELRLKGAYKVLRDDDSEALEGMADLRIRGMALVVARDLASRDAAVRTRAAITLGRLSHVEGIYALKRALDREADGACADAEAEALGLIGGKKGATALAEFAGHASQEGRALEALVRMSGRSSVDRRLAARGLALFAGAREEANFTRMMTVLKGLGYDGLVGLAGCTSVNTTPARLVLVIKELGRSKEPAVARVLAKYFQAGRVPSDAAIRDAAMESVRTMAKKENLGDAVIPHLFVGLRNKYTRVLTTQLLQELTGKDFTVKNWGYWSNWWRAEHPGWKEGEE